MKSITLISLLLILFVNVTFAQDDCIVKLNNAQKYYEQGKLEQIPDLLSECIKKGFNKENKTRALRLLTLVYLFDDDMKMAEETLLQLLSVNPEYKINQAIDPAEFIQLYNSYYTDPFFSIGVVASINLTKPNLIETYSLNSFIDANPSYSTGGVGLSFGLKINYHLTKKIDFIIIPVYSLFTYNISENTTTFNTTTITEKINYMEFPVTASYNFYKIKKYSFFVEAGLSYGLFLSGNISGKVLYNNKEQPDYEPKSISTGELRKKYNLSAIVGLGTQIDLSQSNLQFSIKYNIGLTNIVNTNYRYNPDNKLISEYRFIDNDIFLNNIYFMFSYNRQIFIHKKKQ
jgi:hypothetical protein